MSGSTQHRRVQHRLGLPPSSKRHQEVGRTCHGFPDPEQRGVSVAAPWAARWEEPRVQSRHSQSHSTGLCTIDEILRNSQILVKRHFFGHEKHARTLTIRRSQALLSRAINRDSGHIVGLAHPVSSTSCNAEPHNSIVDTRSAIEVYDYLVTRPAKIVAKFESARSQFSDQPPTSDEVPVTADGRRLDSPTLLIEFLTEIANTRAQRATHSIAS